MTDQPRLPFDGDQQLPAGEAQPPIDTAQIAQQIGEAVAKNSLIRGDANVIPITRVSSAAREDQGHGYFEPVVPDTRQAAIERSRRAHPSSGRAVTPKRPAKVIELPGRSPGSNRPRTKARPRREDLLAFSRSQEERDELRRKLRNQDPS